MRTSIHQNLDSARSPISPLIRGRANFASVNTLPPPNKVAVYFTEYLIFLYVTSMLIALSAPHYNTLSNYFGMLMAGVAVCELVLLRPRGNPVQKYSPLVGLLFFTVMAATAVLYLPAATSFVFRHVQVVVLLAIIFYTVRTTGRITSVSAAFAVGCLALFPFVLQQADFLQAGGGTARLEVDAFDAGEGLNPNGYGIILNIAILLVLYEFFAARSSFSGFGKTIVYVLGITVIAVASYQLIFYLGSRQNQLWLFITVTGMGMLLSRGRLKLQHVLLGSVVAILAVSTLVILLRDSPHLDRLMAPLNALIHGDQLDGSTFTRLTMIKSGLGLWLQSPLWGHGMEGFRIYSGFGTYSHNMFVELLTGYGLLGFCFFLSYHFLALKKTHSLFKRRNPGLRVVLLWIVLSFVGVFVSYMFRPTPYDKPMFVFLGVLGGLAYFLHDHYGCRLRR